MSAAAIALPAATSFPSVSRSWARAAAASFLAAAFFASRLADDLAISPSDPSAACSTVHVARST